MSNNLHVAGIYKIRWAGSWFNYAVNEFDDLLNDIPNLLWGYESEECHVKIWIGGDEGNLKKIRTYISKLRRRKASAVHPCFPIRDDCSGYTNGYVADALEGILKQYDKSYGNIVLQWH
jgi:hypothetical protein